MRQLIKKQSFLFILCFIILLDFKHEKNNIDYFFQKCIENNMHLYKYAFDNVYELNSSDSVARILTVELEPDSLRVLFMITMVLTFHDMLAYLKSVETLPFLHWKQMLFKEK